MNVKPATTHPLATQEIDGMLDMIQTLIDKGLRLRCEMVPSISVPENSRITESFLIRIWMTCSAGNRSLLGDR